MSDHAIYLIGGEDDEAARLVTETRNGDCCIIFRFRNKVIEASSSDYFEAFCRIREQLEPDGLIPFCYGASLNVFPSGMARDMSAGLSAYRLTIGRHASREDVVRIFDAGPDVIPSFVANQKSYFDNWLHSPKG